MSPVARDNCDKETCRIAPARVDRPLQRPRLPHPHRRPTLAQLDQGQDQPTRPRPLPHPPRTEKPRPQRRTLPPTQPRAAQPPRRKPNRDRLHRQRSKPPRRCLPRPHPRPDGDPQHLQRPPTRPLAHTHSPNTRHVQHRGDRQARRSQPDHHPAIPERHPVPAPPTPTDPHRDRHPTRCHRTTLLRHRPTPSSTRNLRLYQDVNQGAARRCPICGKPPPSPKATYCGDTCRMRAYRART